MTASPARAWSKPAFRELIRLRTDWKKFHEKQDRENADLVFRKAGVELITDQDLKFFPHLFRTKLNEFGRDWERPLAVAALREGYVFYRAELLIAVDGVTSLHHWLEQKFGKEVTPGTLSGASLFFESNGLHSLRSGNWDALFYFVLHPSVTPESFQFEESPSIKGTPNFLRIA